MTRPLEQVRNGIWIPPTSETWPDPAQASSRTDPTFEDFASEWLTGRRGEISQSGFEYYTWALKKHLLPYFGDHRLSEIDIKTVDVYRRFKVAEAEDRRARIAAGRIVLTDRGNPIKPLSARSINKTIDVLSAVLAVAVEYEYIERNPASGRRRRLKLPPQSSVHLETAEQIEVMLEAAAELDRRPASQTSGRRGLIAVLMLAGLRATEACNLRWGDVDFANGRLRVHRSKTQAGLRDVDLLPALREELNVHRASRDNLSPEAPAFPSSNGRPRDKDNLRVHVLNPVVGVAEELIFARRGNPLPGKITAHKLRHTFASILVACGEDPASVMAQLGHTDPKFTLRVYTHQMRRDKAERERLKAFVYGTAGRTPASQRQAARPVDASI